MPSESEHRMRRKQQKFFGVEDLQQLRDCSAALDPVRQRPASFPKPFLLGRFFPVVDNHDIRIEVLPWPLPRAPPGCVPSPPGSARCVRVIQIAQALRIQDPQD